MRRLLLLAALALIAIGSADIPSKAARDVQTGSLSSDGGSLELVVFEVDGCIYCGVFRRDVLPTYQLSQHAKGVPIRFVDINDPAADRIGIDGRISMVPTFVLLKDNREVGRIPGYFSPENFFQMVRNLISQAG